MDFAKLFFLLICFWSSSIHCQNHFTRTDILDGLSLPYQLQVISGENVFIKISKPVSGQTNCEVRAPGFDDVDVEKLDSNKLETQLVFLAFN